MDGIGLSAWVGVAGFALGVINTGWLIYSSRVRLRVTAIWAVYDGTGVIRTSRHASAAEKEPKGNFGVQVVNAGRVPVFVDEVGVCTPGRKARIRRLLGLRWEPEERSLILNDAFKDISLPQELPPGAKLYIRAASGAKDKPGMTKHGWVYAETQDARMFCARHEFF